MANGEQKTSRSEDILAAQKKAVTDFGAFLKDSADLAAQYQFHPASWAKVYTSLWSNWVDAFASATRAFLRD